MYEEKRKSATKEKKGKKKKGKLVGNLMRVSKRKRE